MDVTAEAVIALHETSEQVNGLRFTYEPERLRFFQARFEPLHGAGLFRNEERPERMHAMAGATQ